MVTTYPLSLCHFNAIDERICYLDLETHSSKIRIITAYFPHSGYRDTCVQRTYDTLSAIIQDAQTRNMNVMLSGDFNAQVSKRDENDATTTLGKFALEPCNSRGEWLVSWAASHHLTIANTHFDKPQSKITTYYSPSKQPRQLDYILVDKTLFRRTRDAHSTHIPDLGSDHMAVRIRLNFLNTLTNKRRQRRPPSANHQSAHWPPGNYSQYRQLVHDELASSTISDDLDERCSHITTTILQATQQSAAPTLNEPTAHYHHDSQLEQLIRDRQRLPHDSNQRKAVSFAIRKQIQRNRRRHNDEKIKQVIERHQGLRHISDIKRQQGQTLIPSMTTTTGATTNDRQSIADVFATFYEDLYRLRQPASESTELNDTHQADDHDAIVPFSMEELIAGLKQLRSGRCKDTTGLLAEMLKAGGTTLHLHLLRLFNDVIKPTATPPSQWKKTTISVIYKSGDAQLPNNYRPIAIIPLLYKLFARLLYNRLQPDLDRHQSPDQAGFRPDFSTDDHLFTAAILQERSHEWQRPLWVSAVDFKKAFDTINHDGLWQALTHQHVPQQYIHLLQRLYADQTAAVETDKLSRPFDIQRGVKQGDPLSSLLFNALLEDTFRTLKQQWSARDYGIRLGHTRSTQLTNLRFADDVLLFATTLPQLTSMLNSLHDVAAHNGLQLHPDKTVILCNLSQRRGRQATASVTVGGQQVKVLPYHESTKYLGRKLTFDDQHTTELNSRIAAAWRKFNALRDELTNKNYSLRSRLHLFDSTVTPTALYGCSSWTTTKALTTKLRTTQRRMLRLIIKTNRRHNIPQQDGTTPMEPWPEYIKRATTAAEQHLHRLHIESWPTTYLKRKWRWAARVAAQPLTRWTRLSVTWQPQLDHKKITARRQARPRRRWEDDMNSFLETLTHNVENTTHPPSWLNSASDQTTWSQLETQFITYMNLAQPVKQRHDEKLRTVT